MTKLLSPAKAPLLASVILLLLSAAEAFSPALPSRSSPLRRAAAPATIGTYVSGRLNGNPVVVRASEDDEAVGSLPTLPSQARREDGGAPADATPPAAAPAESVSVQAHKTVGDAEGAGEAASYPIDLPSPVLLSTSMVLAIAATGEEGEALFIFYFCSMPKLSSCIIRL